MGKSKLNEILEKEGFEKKSVSASILSYQNKVMKYFTVTGLIKLAIEKGEENIIINIYKLKDSENYACEFYNKKK